MTFICLYGAICHLTRVRPWCLNNKDYWSFTGSPCGGESTMQFFALPSIGNYSCYNLLASFIGYQGETFALSMLSLGRERSRRYINLDRLDE